jgi:hypothetical protein
MPTTIHPINGLASLNMQVILSHCIFNVQLLFCLILIVCISTITLYNLFNYDSPSSVINYICKTFLKTHILNNAHYYGKMEDITEKTDHARKGRLMNIKENFHIYIYTNNKTNL